MNKKVKVLIFSLSENIGGVEILLRNLYPHFDKENMEFHFVTTYKHPVYKEELEQAGAYIHKLPSQNLPFGYYCALKKLIKKYNFDVIHVNKNSSADITPFVLGHKYNIPVIIAHSHNTKSSVGKIADIVHMINRKKMDRYMTHAFASSEEAAEWMFSKKYCQTHSVPILKNGIDISQFTYNEFKRDEIRKRLSLSGKFVVGHIGQFIQRKNHQFLIDIFKEIHKIKPNSVLLLVGSREEMATIQQKAQKEGLFDSVMFMGSQNNINEYYQAMDAFVLPSFAENLPVVGIEAQAAGLPVFVSNTVDAELEITNNIKWLSLEQPAEIWANIIVNTCDCLVREDKSEELKNAGYDISITAEVLEKIYKSAK